jgi:ADP-L-glycero-D-manno-heptose 6-epimerase
MIIVTGGAGFIGSNVVKELNRIGKKDILIVDDLTDGRKYENLKGLSFSSYMDVDEFFDLLKHEHVRWDGIDKIFHIGGISSTTETDGKKVMHYNHYFTTFLYAGAYINNIPFVFTSSASVYGNSTTFNEDDKTDPLNLYAFSKVKCEDFMNAFPLPDTAYIFRPFNVYGPGEDHKDDQASPITKFQKQLDETGSIKIFEGSASIKRDFISVVDVAYIMVNRTNKLGMGGIYNLGTGKAVSFLDVARSMTEDKNIIEIPFPKSLLNKYQYYSCADRTKLNAIIGNGYTFKSVT